jgi:hypothetical protein
MMNLDKRQRAMLREMGVRVWQPLPEPATVLAPPAAALAATGVSLVSAVRESESAIFSGAARAGIDLAPAPIRTPVRSPINAQIDPPKQPTQTVQTATVATLRAEPSSNAVWRAGAMQTLYADSAKQNAERWLILLEAPASALADSFDPLDGDAGKLLDNMLRAAKLPVAGAVLLVPLVRSGPGGDLLGAVTEVLSSAKADVVLVMGRLAAQALLQSTEPLARLRGQIHTMRGQPTIITVEPSYLLRNLQDKAKAWDDLCLALSVTGQAAAQ